MRIATWNVNSLKARLPHVEQWLEYARPDVLCMQETKLADSAFPAMAFQSLGYESAHCGEGRWNGVAILRAKTLPVWLGWVGIVIAVISVTPIGFFGLLATMAWSLIVSVLLYLRGAPAATMAAPA